MKTLNKSGQSLIEFIVLLPLVMGLLMGLIYFGKLSYDYIMLTNAVREGVRAGATGGNDETVKNTIINASAGLQISRSKIEVEIYTDNLNQAIPANNSRLIGQYLLVRLTHTIRLNLFIASKDVTLRPYSSMRIEAISRDGGAPNPPEAPTAEPPAPITIENSVTINENNSLTFTQNVNATLKMLGASITYGAGGPEVPVSLGVQLNLHGQTIEIFKGTGSEITDNIQKTFENVEVGTSMDFTGKSYYPDKPTKVIYTMSTLNGSPMIIALKNGDVLPDETPFAQQPTIEQFLADYIDPVTKIVHLADNELIYLMELGTTNEESGAADFQDLVFKITLDPPGI